MARRSGAFLNDNREFALLVLPFVKELKAGYESGPDGIENCRLLVARIQGLLRGDEARAELDALLAEQRTAAGRSMLHDADRLAEERELCERFGYSSREVKRYVREARKRAKSGTAPAGLSSADDLATQLDLLHARATQAMTASSSKFARWRTVPRARREAHHRLFCIGAIVADTMSRSLFSLSYSVALAGLSKAAGDD